MPAPLHIAIVHHRHRFLGPNSYLVDHLAARWREQGHHVQSVTGIDAPLPQAEITFQHVDLTVVPPGYTRALRRCPLVVNGRVTDISKRRFSTRLVCPGEDYRGPVIVKTNANCGGRPEAATAGMRPGARPGPWQSCRWLKDYTVFPSAREVPDEVWSNGRLVVEKFLPEPAGRGLYCLRVWLFLGDREIHYRNIATGPVVKSSNTVDREELTPEQVPEYLRRVRKLLCFDYGKFDYTLHDGEAVLFDINKTPGMPASPTRRPGSAERVLHLSLGLNSLVERSGNDNRV